MAAKGATNYKQQQRSRWNKEAKDESKKKKEHPQNKPQNKWNFPFCFLFTNQAGTVIFSFSGFVSIF